MRIRRFTEQQEAVEISPDPDYQREPSLRGARYPTGQIRLNRRRSSRRRRRAAGLRPGRLPERNRVEEIINELKSSVTQLAKSREQATSLSNELSNFRSGSRTANNQIDDSALNLDLASSKLEEASAVLDQVIKSLEDYNKKGARYLYG